MLPLLSWCHLTVGKGRVGGVFSAVQWHPVVLSSQIDPVWFCVLFQLVVDFCVVSNLFLIESSIFALALSVPYGILWLAHIPVIWTGEWEYLCQQVFQHTVVSPPKYSSCSTHWRDPSGLHSASSSWMTLKKLWKVWSYFWCHTTFIVIYILSNMENAFILLLSIFVTNYNRNLSEKNQFKN